MIKAILVFNNHGKPRLIKFYSYYVSTVTIVTLILPAQMKGKIKHPEN